MTPATSTLVLLHGLGATAAVWQPLLDHLDGRWEGRCLAPDLAGHGRAPPWPRYSFGGYAAQVAAALHDRRNGDDEVVVMGHSMGGVVALALASGWFGIRPRRTIGLGIKVRWDADELAKAQELSTRPPRSFATRADAAERWLRISGLTGLVPPDDPMVASGVVEGSDGWQLAWDPATAAVGAPPMRNLLDVAGGEVVLARGEHDHLVDLDDLRALVGDPVALAGRGHNAHVEEPADVARLLLA